MKLKYLIALFLVATATTANAAAEVFESARWRDFVRHAEQSYYRTIDSEALRATCSAALTLPKPINDGEPIDVCIRAALGALDQESSYMAPKEFARNEAALKRPFVGVGLELAAVKRPGEGVVIVTPIKGGAAERGGVRSGDVILEIDGRRVGDMDFEGALQALRGEPGSPLRLALQRKETPAPIELTLVRERIRVMRVRSRQISESVAYLRINTFADGVEEQLAEQAALLSRNVERAPALILDLRNNPGGEFDRLVKIASFFCEPEVHLLTLVQKADSKTIKSSDAGTPRWLRTVPLVVLVNRGTASGAEALAQVLRERRGAKLVGEATLGFGLVATRFVLDGAAAIRLGTARMESGLGAGWLESGLVVDVHVTDVPVLEFGARGDASIETGERMLFRESRP
jgi:carboxyl-terminal processing protease